MAQLMRVRGEYAGAGGAQRVTEEDAAPLTLSCSLMSSCVSLHSGRQAITCAPNASFSSISSSDRPASSTASTVVGIGPRPITSGQRRHSQTRSRCCRIRTDWGGYRQVVHPDRVDAVRFGELLAGAPLEPHADQGMPLIGQAGRNNVRVSGANGCGEHRQTVDTAQE
ncbi:hypothetical protein GCM10009789_40530 [Kribbella sancticallisti]|uniref:Uncharacterized protein n=1 Tax=Kribbella sancticallisti TaxID=460087 RepID=A0ABP4PNG3_9ACTN